MKKLIAFLTVAAIFLCVTISVFAQKKSPSTLLNVVIDDSVSGSYGVQSDDTDKTDTTTRPYKNGTESVQAVFDSNGHFVFNSGTRLISFLYTQPYPYDVNKILATDTQLGVKARTFPINTIDYVPMQNMTIGTSQCLGLGWELPEGDVEGTKREIGYHYFRGDKTQTAYIVVTYDGNAWTIESVDRKGCGSTGDPYVNDAARVRDTKTVKGKITDYDIYGLYLMPFKLVLTRQ